MSHASITREVSLNLTVQEVATAFAHFYDDEQALFFDEVGKIAKGWPSGGWCMQSCTIVPHLTPLGRETILTLAGHIEGASA